MINKTKKLNNQLKSLIDKEKDANKPIKVKIIKQQNKIITVTHKKPNKIPENTPVTINNKQAIITKNKNKQSIITLEKNEKINNKQQVYMKNKQQEIIIKKIEETNNNIQNNKLNSQNKETLTVLLKNKSTKYNNKKYKNPQLNKNQYDAMIKSLNTTKYHIIQGPPGTGKTHTITAILTILQQEKQKTLITTHTHIALDNILEKLESLPEEKIIRIGQNNKISKKTQKYTIKKQIKKHNRQKEIKIIQKEIDKITTEIKQHNKEIVYYNNKINNLNSTKPSFLKRLFHKNDKIEEIKENYQNIIQNLEIKNDKNKKIIQEKKLEIEKIEKEIKQTLIKEADIIAATVLSTTNVQINDIEFDYLVMDESSQVPFYLALIPLMKTDKFILVGDNKQLQPIENEYASYQLNKSIFNLMIEKYPKNYTFLNIQYRMNKNIAKIASKLYYDSKLKTDKSSENNLIKLNEYNNILLNNDKPITFIDTSNTYYYEEKTNNSCYNEYEAKVIYNLISYLVKNNIKEKDIGIISPYRKQKQLISKILKKEGYNIEVDTIYRFQGREKDIILLSFCKKQSWNT